MIRLPSLATAGLIASTSLSMAAPQLERVRGTVVSATATSVIVKAGNNKTQEITLAPDTKFVSVLTSSLDEVKDGKFIGTATKGDNPPVALEVVIFPASMNGTAEGHYAWDTINDTTSANSPMGMMSMSKSSMTNGTVKTTAKPMTKSAMTNGTIKKGTSAGGSKLIDVGYDNGQSLTIKVPPSAPIVAFEPADSSILKPGAHLFSVTVVGDGKLTGKMVAVGKDGVTPPM